MHTLVEMLMLSRKEFERNLTGLTDEDARKRLEPMNCISWIIAHVANQHRSYFVDFPKGEYAPERYLLYGYGSEPSQPSLEEAMELWREACRESEPWLESATDEDMVVIPEITPDGENIGTMMVRCIFHTWDHLGEISSIRQILGHKPPQFVDMHNWMYRPK
ncbi:MAG: DUF664 domain-containing protein [Dehalococcoidales bacterium]|nr:DUF664 domain-containing protein [Dehalococcoidales bacterium]